MAREVINVGAAPNDGQGDPIRTSFIKTNNNFGELYSRAQTSPPGTLVGSIGDEAGMYAYDENFFYYCFQNYDGSSTIWAQVTNIEALAIPNIINGESVIAIPAANANISVSVANIANVAVFTVDGAEFANVTVNGTLTTAGNVIAHDILPETDATYDLGSASLQWNNLYLTGSTIYLGNATIESNATSVTITTGSGGAFTIDGANAALANVLTPGEVSASGNVTGGNLQTSGVVSATGNITSGGVFIGDGSGLFGVVAVANVGFAQLIQSGSTQLNVPVSGGNIIGNIGGQVNLFEFSTVGFSAQGNITGGNILTAGAISTSGNITAGNLITTGLLTTTANLSGGNLLTSGQVSAGGNITGGNILSSGRISSAGNVSGGNITTVGAISAAGVVTAASVVAATLSGTANQASFINTAVGSGTNTEYSVPYFESTSGFQTPKTDSNFTFNPSLDRVTAARVLATTSFTGPLFGDVTGNLNGTSASLTGNVEASNFLTPGQLIATQTANVGNLNTGGTISAVGNITGNYILGNGSLLSGIITSVANINNGTSNVSIGSPNGNATVGINGSGNVAVFSTAGLSVSGVASASGNITGGNLLTAGQISATGNITGANLTVNTGNIGLGNLINNNANGVGNIGSSTIYFNTVFAKATSAQYADLAEKYQADKSYAPGTVLKFGGAAEVTECDLDHDVTVAGIVSADPAYIMNAGLSGVNAVALALAGRVPCLVQGPVRRGQMLVSAGNGRARAEVNPQMGSVIGKALQDFTGDTGMIEVVVGRL